MFRLMCITAHPDDEAGGFGGTLRLYHDRDVETCVICLTPGQAASHRGNAKTDHDLANLRRKEFAAACEILQVTRGIVLDYPDGQLHRQDLYKVVCELTRQVREFRPQVVMTFGPEGAVTGHTDHSMASVFASLAFHWSGRTNRYPDQFAEGLKPHRPQKLYYATADFNLPDRIDLELFDSDKPIGDDEQTRLAQVIARLPDRQCHVETTQHKPRCFLCSNPISPAAAARKCSTSQPA